MTAHPRDLTPELSAFCLAGTEDDWHRFEAVLSELLSRPLSASEMRATFGLFERHPNGDSFGLFWSLLHKLEAQPGYEPFLLASVRRVPSEFGVRMVGSILNGGQQDIAGSPTRPVLTELLQRTDTAPNYKEYIQTILDRNA